MLKSSIFSVLEGCTSWICRRNLIWAPFSWLMVHPIAEYVWDITIIRVSHCNSCYTAPPFVAITSKRGISSRRMWLRRWNEVESSAISSCDRLLCGNSLIFAAWTYNKYKCRKTCYISDLIYALLRSWNILTIDSEQYRLVKVSTPITGAQNTTEKEKKSYTKL